MHPVNCISSGLDFVISSLIVEKSFNYKSIGFYSFSLDLKNYIIYNLFTGRFLRIAKFKVRGDMKEFKKGGPVKYDVFFCELCRHTDLYDVLP